MTSFEPGLARHDSSGKARAATSAQRATRHYFYRPARPLTPSRPHLPLAPVKPYPFSLSLTVTAPNPTPILSRGAIRLQHSDLWRRRLAWPPPCVSPQRTGGRRRGRLRAPRVATVGNGTASLLVAEANGATIPTAKTGEDASLPRGRSAAVLLYLPSATASPYGAKFIS
jgi:hypothetical protein